jgi:hypothetical protein
MRRLSRQQLSKLKIKQEYLRLDKKIAEKEFFKYFNLIHNPSFAQTQRTQKDERLKLFEGSGTKDVGTWSPVMELSFPLPASRPSSPVPTSRSVFPFVEIFDFIKDKHRL